MSKPRVAAGAYLDKLEAKSQRADMLERLSGERLDQISHLQQRIESLIDERTFLRELLVNITKGRIVSTTPADWQLLCDLLEWVKAEHRDPSLDGKGFIHVEKLSALFDDATKLLRARGEL